MNISLIVPAYNEEALILSTLEPIIRFLSKSYASSEIIVVDDGSTDDTGVILDEYAAGHFKNVSIHVLHNDGNRGKGFSVQRGMLAADGDVCVFMDADLPFELEALKIITDLVTSGAHLVIGDRNHDRTELVKINPIRVLAGRTYGAFVRLLISGGITDTQCGLKGFSAHAARLIFKRTTIPRFGFDVEALRIAQKHKLSIERIPVVMVKNRMESKVHIVSDSLQMLLDLYRIWRNERQGLYD